MKVNQFTLPETRDILFTITHSTLNQASELNQHEVHIHKECEIYINFSGDVVFEVENHIYPIARGSVILASPYEHHHCIYRSDIPHENYWITFSSDANVMELLFNRKRAPSPLRVLQPAELERVHHILEKLLDKNTDSLDLRIGFWELIRAIRNAKQSDGIQNTDALSPVVKTAMAYMEDHSEESIGIKQIAEAASVSVNTLERYFKKELQASPMQVLRRSRLITSRKHLQDVLSVSEASRLSGFDDYSNYIQLFRKQFGMTPMQFKKKMEEE